MRRTPSEKERPKAKLTHPTPNGPTSLNTRCPSRPGVEEVAEGVAELDFCYYFYIRLFPLPKFPLFFLLGVCYSLHFRGVLSLV